MFYKGAFMNRLYFLILSFFLLGTGGKASPIALEETVGQPKDSAILFRFVPGKLMFYSPFQGNENSIVAAAKLIEQHRPAITSGKAWIEIQGFCGSYGNRAANLRAAKNRSNQVKSWFITHYGLKEEYYRTCNSDQSYQGIRDVVALMGIRYADGFEPQASEEASQARRDSLNQLRADSLEAVETSKEIQPDTVPEVVEEIAPQVNSTTVAEVSSVRVYESTPWYIKSNLIYDVLLMPSLEVEYRFNEQWSAAVEGSMAWWHNDGKHKYYQLATIVPEVRYWFKPQGKRKGHYVGLFGGGGWYDLENGNTGYRGEGGMVGVSYGYMFPIGKYFAFEAGLGVGYMTTKNEEYIPQDGHYTYQQSNRTNYVGPLKLKFAFVWNIGRWTEKGGDK